MTMKPNEQTIQQIERVLHKTAEKFPATENPSIMTDIHLRVTQDTGELVVCDDDDNEITRSVIEQWIDNKDENFYEQITSTLRRCIEKIKNTTETLGLLKPFSYILENDDKENVAELYVVDDDTVIIDKELMANLDKDLNDFFIKLLEEK